jgi:glycogen operon protein
VDRLSAFFDIIHQDPVLSQVKLIAEPWDLGEGGYQVGNFPVGWAEWNGKYRDTVRRFWKGDGGVVSELATRLAGSSDLYEWNGRRPHASINFVTAHDGFTLRDLVSYNTKQNDANGEGNRDGTDHNISWNCGVEGLTDDPAIRAIRLQQMRNFLATLLLSQGVPMICGGDEIGRTQLGNNNSYCQDNEISWFSWTLGPDEEDLLAFTRHVIALRRSQPVLRRRRFFQGRAIHGNDITDIAWFLPSGSVMDERSWNTASVRSLGVYLSGSEIGEVNENGDRIYGDTLYIAFNAAPERARFVLPRHAREQRWERLLDTAQREWQRLHRLRDHSIRVAGRSVVVCRLIRPSPDSGVS